MRLLARSWNRVSRMMTLWWSSRPRALFVDLFGMLATSFYFYFLFFFYFFIFWRVRGDICEFCPLRVRVALGPSSLLKLEGCPQPLGTWSRGRFER